MKNLKKALNKYGCTKYDIDATHKATNFLINAFVRSAYHHRLIKQTASIIDTGGLTEEDWKIFVELQWYTIAPQADVN